jgi:hypothetical protein
VFAALRWGAALSLLAIPSLAQTPASSETPAETPTSAPAPAPAAPAPEDDAVRNRTSLNLLGQTNTERGESRRNENVQITLIDNNATRELNSRVGTTATIIAEFQADRSYFSAELGNAPRGGFHVAPQSGSGAHGQLFWSHQNSIFTARAFFQVGPVQPARSNQYGATLASRLWRDAFGTFNLSQNKNRGQVNGNILIPLPEERTPLTRDPVLYARIQRYFDAYPNVLPNRTDMAARALNTNSPQTIDTDNHSGQITQQLGANDGVALRYSFTGQRVDAFQFVRGQNPNTRTKSHTATATWHHVSSPQTVLDFTAGFERQTTRLEATADAVGPVFVQGLNMLGPPFDVPRWRVQNRLRASGAAQHRWGSHTVTYGVAGTRLQYNSDEPEVLRGLFQFNPDFGRDGITNLRVGTPSRYLLSIGTAYRAFRNWELQAYIGDRWQATGRLTVNAALRWEPLTKPWDASGMSRLPFDSDWNNLAPSLGLAYRLPGNWGVLRAAGGVMFGQIFPVTYGVDRYNRPYNSRLVLQAPDLLNPLAGVETDPAKTRSSEFRLSPNLATPYSYQFNFSWERELTRNWRLSAGYTGSRSHKLFFNYLWNRAVEVPGIPYTTATVADRRPDPNVFEILDIHNGSRAFYDAGVATLSTPRWHGLSLTTSYWWSKAIDYGTDYTFTGVGNGSRENAGQSGVDVRKDQKGLSDYDQPHAALTQIAYVTPRARGWWDRITRDWTVASVILLKSGTPFTVMAGGDGPGVGNVDGLQGDRPMLLDPSVLGRIVGDPDTAPRLLPRSAFRFMNAPLEMQGSLGRNTFRKGKIANVNASIQRSFPVRDWQLVWRAESINFFNTPQFAAPGDNLAAPNFGQITNTLNDGRTFRFTLRLAF